MSKLSLTTAFITKPILIGLAICCISRSDTKAAVPADTAAQELGPLGRFYKTSIAVGTDKRRLPHGG